MLFQKINEVSFSVVEFRQSFSLYINSVHLLTCLNLLICFICNKITVGTHGVKESIDFMIISWSLVEKNDEKLAFNESPCMVVCVHVKMAA
uniref:Uncharacterized protein n=1 Tax=Rhizophora mucronata TaxID=61149 RepID=A0A2P2QDC3_RHIMU